MIDICVVIVTYKTPDLLRRCLLSVEENLADMQVTPKVVVVDNASNDDTIGMLTREFPRVDIIANEKNEGPAKGFNQGIEFAFSVNARYVVLCNSDIKVQPTALDRLYSYLEGHPECLGATGRLINEDGTPQMQRITPSKLAPNKVVKEIRISWIGTGFGMLRTETYRRIGGFDENYYFFNEDLDWVYRARKARLEFVLLPKVFIIHRNHAGMEKNYSRIIRELYKANAYMFKRHFPLLAPIATKFMELEIRLKKAQLKKGKLRASSHTGLSEEDFDVALELLREEVKVSRKPQIPYFGG